MIRAFLSAAILVVPTGVVAQTAVTIAPSAEGNVLRAGTKVPVRTLVELSTKGKALKIGDRINVEVSEAVMHGNNVVIPAGTPGVAELTTVRNKGMWGKSGFVEGRILYLRLGGRQIRMSGVFNDKGVTGTGAVVGAVLLVPVVGFFTTGTSANIPNGSILPGFLDEDIVYEVATTAPIPIVAATPAVVPAAPVEKPKATKASLVDPSLEIRTQ